MMALRLDFITQTVPQLAMAAFDLVLPPRCLACGDELAQDNDLCAPCWSRLNFISGSLCRVCGRPQGEHAIADGACGDCLDAPPPFDRMRAALAYDFASKPMILGLKHRERLEGVGLFAKWMLAAGGPMIERAEVILPVPVHRMKLVRRGFNQAAVIAQAIAKQAGKPCPLAALRKIEQTRPQVGLNADERAQNVTEASFTVPSKQRAWIDGKRLLLIDDVYTTGTTTAACCAVLKRAGARQIDILTLARVVNGGDGAI